MKRLFALFILVVLIKICKAQPTADCSAATSQSYLHINEIKVHLSSSGAVWGCGFGNGLNPNYIVNTNEENSIALTT